MPGVIAAGGPDTAAAGAAMLRRGGNAVDAAVAAAFVSFIAEIGVVHWGGSGLAQIWAPDSGRNVVYDFFSNMPGLANPGPASLDFHRVTVDFGATRQDFHLGRASVAVPGNLIGLCQLAADLGRLPLPTLLEPAIRAARDGIILEPFQADTCELLRPLYTHTPGLRAIFAPSGRLLQAGDRLIIPDLATTLIRLAAEGPTLMRRGHLARSLIQDQAENGGLITATDLEQYQVYRRDPIAIPYRDYVVQLPPPSSSGGVLIAFSLKLMNHFPIRRLRPGTAAHLRLLYEIMAATNRARPFWERLHEAERAEVAVAAFLADEHVAQYRSEVVQALDRRLASESPPHQPSPGHTSHLSVIDGDGLAVSLTTTAGESAGYVLSGTGFIPNNMLGEADLFPNGFHNRPSGQRIPTMMAPTIVRRDGAIRLVVGTGGSERIRSAILQVLSNLLDFEMRLQVAVDRPRVHLEGRVLQCEHGYDEHAVTELASWGYPVNRWASRSIYFGGAHSVSRTPGGRLVAAGDNRRGGATARVR